MAISRLRRYPMAFSALADKSWSTAQTWADATQVFPTGPQDMGGSAVDEIDSFGRWVISDSIAVVVNVSATPTPAGVTCDVAIQSDDNPAFSSPIVRFSRPAVLTATSGRKGTGVGPHYLGQISGPMERYLRFGLTPHGTTPNM